MGESGTIENPMGGISVCTVFYFAFCVSPLCLGIGIMIRLEITISTNSGVQHTMENWTIIKRLVQRMFFFKSEPLTKVLLYREDFVLLCG